MDLRESGQDYLEAIYVLKEKNGAVKSVDIANYLSVTKQSVHRAIKNLKESGFISVSEKGQISFTEDGEKVAIEIYEKHRILSSFFISLGVPSEIAYLDACKIEHDISTESFNAIKALVLKNEIIKKDSN